MLSAAFQMLHFQAFLDHSGPIPEKLAAKMVEMHQNPSELAMDQLEVQEEYLDIMA